MKTYFTCTCILCVIFRCVRLRLRAARSSESSGRATAAKTRAARRVRRASVGGCRRGMDHGRTLGAKFRGCWRNVRYVNPRGVWSSSPIESRCTTTMGVAWYNCPWRLYYWTRKIYSKHFLSLT